MNTQTQTEKRDRAWLLSKGWTVRKAAEALKRSPQQVSEVLRGRRPSRRLVRLMEELPILNETENR